MEGQPTEEPVLRSSFLLELGEESKLGQHNVDHAKVALEYTQGVERLAVAHACLGMQLLVNDLGFFLRRSIVSPVCETRVHGGKTPTVSTSPRIPMSAPCRSQDGRMESASQSPTATLQASRASGVGTRGCFPEVEATTGVSGPRDDR